MGKEMGGRFKREKIYVYGSFMLRFYRKQQNCVKQLSFKKNKFKETTHKRRKDFVYVEVSVDFRRKLLEKAEAEDVFQIRKKEIMSKEMQQL